MAATVQITRDRVLFPKQKKVFDLLEYDPKITEAYFGGAAGGGKSQLGCMWQQYRRCKYPGTVGLIGRSTYTDLEETTMETFWRVWDSWGRYNPLKVTCYQKGNHVIFSNGAKILLRWVRDRKGPNSDPNFGFGSLDLTDCFLDEMTEIPETVFEVVKSRIRFNLVNEKPAILSCSNPAHNWVKHRYIKDENGVPIRLEDHQAVILATLADNKDRKFAEIYRRQLEQLPPSARSRLLHGDWDYIDNEDPFFYHFNIARHVTDVEPPVLKYEPLLLSFDFNVDPCTVLVAQNSLEYGLVVHATHQAKPGTDALLKYIEPFGYQVHPAGIIVTGDVSGHARHSSSAGTEYGDLQTDYGKIKEALMISDFDIRHTSHQNPRHKYSRNVCNHAFYRNVVTIYRDRCHSLISDIQSARPDKQGKLFKDRNLGQGQDAGDTFRYLINMAFPAGFPDINKFADMLIDQKGESFTDNSDQNFDSLNAWQEGKIS